MAVEAHGSGESDPVVTELVTAVSAAEVGANTVPRMAAAASWAPSVSMPGMTRM